MIRDKKNEIINVSGGISKDSDGGLRITGDAKFEETPEGHVVTYQGKTYKSTAERPVTVTGCATAAHATDWDADGDFSLALSGFECREHAIGEIALCLPVRFRHRYPVTR